MGSVCCESSACVQNKSFVACAALGALEGGGCADG
jgi:hypothetical protein